MEASAVIDPETPKPDAPEQPVEDGASVESTGPEPAPEPVSGVILLSTGQTRAVANIAPVVEALSTNAASGFIAVTTQDGREVNVRVSEIVTYE